MDLWSAETKEPAKGNKRKFEIQEDAGDVLVCRVITDASSLPGELYLLLV